MSADNGIYIGNFSDGVRAIHAQAIDNLWYPNDENSFYIWEYFKDSPIYPDLVAAYAWAGKQGEELFEEGLPLEYGVSYLAFNKPFAEYTKEALTSPEYKEYNTNA
jgi:hypothetical protein